MPDLTLIELPGGPYRLTISDTPEGRWFTAAEMVPTADGPVWHEVADSPSWHQLVHELLTRFLRREVATS